MEEFSIPAGSDIIGQNCLQNAAATWHRKHCLQDHVKQALEHLKVNEDIKFAYRIGFGVGTRGDEQMTVDNNCWWGQIFVE